MKFAAGGDGIGVWDASSSSCGATSVDFGLLPGIVACTVHRVELIGVELTSFGVRLCFNGSLS